MRSKNKTRNIQVKNCKSNLAHEVFSYHNLFCVHLDFDTIAVALLCTNANIKIYYDHIY